MRAQLTSLAAVLSLLSCSSGNVIGPENQLQVSNATNSFQFQVTGLVNVRQTLRYDWSNTGDSANVNQATSITHGAATLTIRDPNGAVVYQASLGNNGTYHTGKSVAGRWRIEVALQDVDGTINFRVQKAP